MHFPQAARIFLPAGERDEDKHAATLAAAVDKQRRKCLGLASAVAMAEAEVSADTASKDLDADCRAQMPILEQTGKETAELMAVVSKEQTAADIEVESVAKEAAAADIENAAAAVIEKDVSADLAMALPAMVAAEKALKSIQKKDIDEMKKLGKAPAGCELVMRAITIMFGVKTKKIADPNSAKGGKMDDHWGTAKIVMGEATFLDDLLGFKDRFVDAGKYDETTIEKLKPVLEYDVGEGKDRLAFTAELCAKKGSAAAGCLVTFVLAIKTYFEVVRTVNAKSSYASAAAELAEMEALLATKRVSGEDLARSVRTLVPTAYVFGGGMTAADLTQLQTDYESRKRVELTASQFDGLSVHGLEEVLRLCPAAVGEVFVGKGLGERLPGDHPRVTQLGRTVSGAAMDDLQAQYDRDRRLDLTDPAFRHLSVAAILELGMHFPDVAAVFLGPFQRIDEGAVTLLKERCESLRVAHLGRYIGAQDLAVLEKEYNATRRLTLLAEHFAGASELALVELGTIFPDTKAVFYHESVGRAHLLELPTDGRTQLLLAEESIALGSNARRVQQLQQDFNFRLQQAENIIAAADAALDSLDKGSFAELKAFGSPDEGVVMVASCCVVLTAGKPKVPKDVSWAAAKKMMGNVGQFLDSLLSFDKDSVDDVLVAHCEKVYLSNPEFEYENIKNKTPAAAGLCSWCINICKYCRIYQMLAPKRAELAAANAKLGPIAKELSAQRNKWAGSVTAEDGRIYCVPFNAVRSMPTHTIETSVLSSAWSLLAFVFLLRAVSLHAGRRSRHRSVHGRAGYEHLHGSRGRWS